MSPEDLLYTVSIILFLDLIILVSLSYYFKKLSFQFLRFGTMAMAAEAVAQVAFFSWAANQALTPLILVGSVAKFAYAILIIVSLAHMMGRAIPFKLMTACTLFFLVNAIYSRTVGDDITLHWVLGEVGPVALICTGIYYLISSKDSSLPIYLLSGVLALHVILKLAMPYIASDVGLFSLSYLFSCLLVIVIGVLQLMISSDQMMNSLQDKNTMLANFRQENKRLELQFTQAQKLESLGVMAGGIAHDFNNMLTSILGYASLAMKKLPASSDVRKDLYMVMSGARQAVDLTSQMLIYAGKGAIEFESVDIAKVVDNMSSLINSIVPRKIRLVQKVTKDLPRLKGDQVQLGQVLMNLVANAVDALDQESGTIQITTGLTEVDGGRLRQSFFASEAEVGAYLYLSVKDSGSGMDTEQVSKIFDPFYSEKGVSKGLGLSSISGIVRQHGGFIHVQSNLGEGSEFTVYFPALSYSEVVPKQGSQFRSSSQNKGEILLADDDPRIRSLIQSILESDHFELTSTEDGKEAMKMVTQDGPNYVLFLLDCTMPKMSGTEVYRQIRAQGLTTPVILISGYHQEQVISNISNDPNAHFIKKPFNVDELLDQVDRALSEQILTS